MMNHRTELAALNNVYWYHAMFSAHGIACASDDLTWWSAAAAPPFHSNLVVLSPLVTEAHVRQKLRSIERALSPAGWAVKDSFARLDLSAQGYQVLFDANWIWREPEPSRPGGNATVAAWRVVTSPDELRAWEVAWRGGELGAADATASCQFPASLLASPCHRFLARMEGRQVVAGAIANRSPGGVGLSNAFGVGSPVFDEWDGLIRCAEEQFPAVPMVGFERGAALESAVSAGFAVAGPLRLWSRAPEQASG